MLTGPEAPPHLQKKRKLDVGPASAESVGPAIQSPNSPKVKRRVVGPSVPPPTEDTGDAHREDDDGSSSEDDFMPQLPSTENPNVSGSLSRRSPSC